MAEFTGSRFVLAVRDLAASKSYYCDVLGFVEESIRAPGWAFLRRGPVLFSLGECPSEVPASQLGEHSYFAYILVDNAASLSAEVEKQGAMILHPLADKAWGMREFCVQTPDGHRIVFGQAR